MIEAVGVLALMGGVFGAVLAVAAKKFEIQVDERIPTILAILPGANCGACGYPGCAALAEAIVENSAPINACVVAQPHAYSLIANIMSDVAVPVAARKVAQLKCCQPLTEASKLYEYQGVADCHLAVTMFNGSRLCNYGCFGLGSCAKACPFHAITIGTDGLPKIDHALCTGCGVCVNDCPQFILALENASQEVHIRCNNLDRGKAAMDVCPQACISCSLCVKACPEQAISMTAYKNGGSLPKIDGVKCVQCGLCVEKCPRKCIFICPPVNGAPPTVDQNKSTGCAACGLCGEH